MFNHSTLDVSDITPKQVGMAHKCFFDNDVPFYLVENSQHIFDEDNMLIEYKVTYSKERGFQCTCKAGKEGFAHCRNFCWHVRAAVACAREEREAMAEQARLNAEQQVITTPAQTVVKIEYTDVDAQTLARIQRRDQERKEAKPKTARKVAYAQTRPGGFSLFKK